jgi:hypothetical protein
MMANPLEEEDDWTEEEERAGDAIVSQPHVQAGLRRLAEEAQRQIAAGETIEGGFGCEEYAVKPKERT